MSVASRQVRIEAEALLRRYLELIEDERLLLDTLEGETDIVDVARAVARDIIMSEAYADALTARIAEMKIRQARVTHRGEKGRQALLEVMNSAGLKKLPLPEFTVAIGHRAPAPIKPDNADDLPDELCRIKREPSMTAIKAAIAAGAELPFNQFDNGAEFVVIRKS